MSDALFPPPREFQQRAHQALRDGVRAGHRCQVLMAATGSGKCLGFGTPVLMADGTIKQVQDVAAGDRLMGPDGHGRNVLSVASGREELYRITPKKGDPYVVNASHILSLRKTPGCDSLTLADGTRIGRDDDIVNVNVETFMRSNATARHCLKGWRAPAIKAFERDDEELQIPAYILGAWLGDGTQGHAAISKPPCRMVDAWIEYGKSIGYGVSVRQYRDDECPTWALSGFRNGVSFNIIQCRLDALGVLHNRHIPDDYKFAPLADRLQLLAGLIDSDGHISHNGCDWISKSERLANDFAFVCRSVGLAAYVSKQQKGIAETGFVGWYWRVSVSGDLSELPMRDKVAGKREQKKRHLVHGISIEPIGEGNYYGFEIDGDRLFLLGDFTVTHNTYLGLRIISEALQRGRRAAFVCDRTTLIEQTSRTADLYGLRDHGVMQADHWRTRLHMPFQIASVQTLRHRKWPRADVIVIDECHTMHKEATCFVAESDAVVIGLSATPFSAGLGKVFSRVVNAATMHDLTQSGVLVPMRVLSAKRPDMRGAKVGRDGEWSDSEAAARGMEIIGDVVAEWIKHGQGRKTICFGSTIDHCMEIVRQFNAAGVMAAAFTSHTSDRERESLLSEYRKTDSALRVLVSVEALAKGFDVPDVGCVIDCRPLRKSLSTAIQMWGRGLRSSPETGKQDAILLDHSGNIIRFREDFEDVYFNGLAQLDDGERLDKTVRKEPEEDKAPKGCPVCGYRPFARRCMSCGHEARSSGSSVVHEAGEMREVVLLGGKKMGDNKAHVWAQCASYARAFSAPEKQQARAACIYKDILGAWPPRSWTVESAPRVEVTRPVINAITRARNAWRRGQQRARMPA